VISIIIPTLNEGKYLNKALLAIKGQKCDDEFEIVVSDSYSDDNTQEIAKRHGARVVLSERLGPAVGRNQGAKVAKGDILVFIDADTLPSENVLARITDLLEKRGDVIGGTCQFLPSGGGLVDWFLYALTNATARIMIKFGIPQDPGYCFFYRRKVFEKLGGLREDLVMNETHDLAIRSKPYGKFVYLNVPVFTSLRRYKKVGYFRTLGTYIKSTIAYFRKGEVPKSEFKFEPVR